MAQWPRSHSWCNNRSRSSSQHSPFGIRRKAHSTARSNDPAWLTTCFARCTPHSGTPANVHHASNRSTPQVLLDCGPLTKDLPSDGHQLTFAQMLHLAGMMQRHLWLLFALILAFSGSAQTFSGAVKMRPEWGFLAPSSPPKTKPATCSATSVFPMGPIPWTSERGQDNASP